MDLNKFMSYGAGLFTVYWDSGGSSEASIGVMSSGVRWIAPTNWIFPAEVDDKILCSIKRLEKIG